jgi:hypothetical protein
MKDTTKIKLGIVGRAILAAVGATGILTMAMVAPNAVQILKLFDRRKVRKYDPKYRIPGVIEKLKIGGFITFKNVRGGPCVRLTNAGRLELLKYQLGEKVIKSHEWDGKWRVVIFDIKEWNRGLRDALRRELNGLGFIKLQHSVWISPHECEEVIAMLKANFRIGKDVLYLTVEKVENDGWLRKEFSL